MKRVPRFWRGQVVVFREACEVVEQGYKEVLREQNGHRVMWIKLLQCKDDKKRKQYMGVVVNFLQNLVMFFENVVFEKDKLCVVVRDILKEAVKWYNRYFVFTVLSSVKVFEVFEGWVVQNYGSVDRYIQLKGQGVRVKSEIGMINVEGVELRKVGELYTF